GSSVAARGTPLTSWLSLSGATSNREAAAAVFGARDLDAHSTIRDAALAGRVQVRQARGIVKALDALPTSLSAEQKGQAAALLVDRAAHTPADRLAGLAPAVLADVAPELVPDPDARLAAMDAQKKRAHARRGLSLVPDGDGSVLIRGSLPDLSAAPFIKLIDAYVESDRRAGRDRAADRRDPRAELRSLDQRRADALLTLVAAHQAAQTAPRVAGDRPRIVVTMREADLRERAEQAGLLKPDQQISAGDLRRVCCDADLTPVVLGSESEILDVGRTIRLVTPALRRALSVRDGGCVFPGCLATDERCDAHHIVPWWWGGETGLSNLVLLCPHHHALVEPPRFWSGAPPDRWQIRLDKCGRPEVIPPARVDPERTPMSRARTPRSAVAGGTGNG
ncbi:MAG: DUF222 domain-containing protein, partial [Actinomycetes bacterium]